MFNVCHMIRTTIPKIRKGTLSESIRCIKEPPCDRRVKSDVQ